MKVFLTSLGCPKNRVDAEHMLGIAAKDGHEVVEDPQNADALVVNTCAFINDAKEESIDSILEMAQVKHESGDKKKLIVTGCLAQRYSKELEKELPEVDYLLGTSDYSSIKTVLTPDARLPLKKPQKNLVTQNLQFLEQYDLPRVQSNTAFSSYLKISEGCDNKCTFCIIPKLRGKQRSRKIEDLVKAASNLAESGSFELNLIGQDLTAYGFDFSPRGSLGELLLNLSDISELKWIRQLYAYPRTFPEVYYKAFEKPNVLPYLDMPLQHASANVLKSMKRGGDKKRLTRIIGDLKKNIPGLVLRTTMMVGFPGETNDDFQELLEFMEENQFDRLGAFKYSNEENTQAYDFSCQIPQEVKEERYRLLMATQNKIASEKAKKLIGTIQEAVVTGPSKEHELLLEGRLWSQAPDIDGITYISSPEPLKVGERIKLKITQTHDYDFVGEYQP